MIPMHHTFLILKLAFLALVTPLSAQIPFQSTGAVPAAGDCASRGVPLTDRWLEGDFRFFDRDNPKSSVDAFFERFSGYYEASKDGVAGIMLNVGWFADVVLAYSGTLDSQVPLAVFRPLDGENSGQTMGDDVWTYRQVQGVVSALKEGARRHLGREDFRVGLLLLGWSSIYYAETPVWFKEHPESFRWGRRSLTDPHYLFLDYASSLRPDSRRYAAFPDGIPAATRLPHFLAAQWAELSRATGFDTLLLRDGMLGLSSYRHASPAWDNDCFEGLRTCLREIKRLAPKTMTIGYSVGGSAIAELRSGSFDLRTLARDGCLDAWITQSWGCNWIEQKRLELTPAMQVPIILVHRALLEGTGVKHYPVFNMLDAYEFLTTKTFAERWQALRWEIWAYTHASLNRYWDTEGTWGLKEGAPLSMASGIYGSWFHVRDRMLSAEDTELLTRETEKAVTDARATTKIGGINMVVHDDFARRCNGSADPFAYHGENVDETAGLLVRAGLPILSSSRITERDFAKNNQPLLLHNPVNLPLDLLAALKRSPIALVVGSADTSAGFDALKWNPAEKFDPLGDGRRLRYELMPKEVSDLSSEVWKGIGGPRFLTSPGQCLHLQYWWTAEGSLMLLIGNIEVGAKSATVELLLPNEWLNDQKMSPGSLVDSSEPNRTWQPTRRDEGIVFTIDMAANTSLVCQAISNSATPKIRSR